MFLYFVDSLVKFDSIFTISSFDKCDKWVLSDKHCELFLRWIFSEIFIDHLVSPALALQTRVGHCHAANHIILPKGSKWESFCNANNWWLINSISGLAWKQVASDISCTNVDTFPSWSNTKRAFIFVRVILNSIALISSFHA